MAQEDEIIRILLDVGGLPDAQKLIDAMDNVKRSQTAMAQSMLAAGKPVDEIIGKLQPLQSQYDGLKRSLDAFKRSGDGFSAWGERNAQGILHVSHALQDLQYGMGAVLNNIPLMVQAFGGGAQWSGALMVAAVGLDQAFQHLGPVIHDVGVELGLLEDPTKQFIATAKQAEEVIKALTARPHKISMDYYQINDAKMAAQQLNDATAAWNAARRGTAGEELAKETARIGSDYGNRDDLVRAVRASDDMAKFVDPKLRKDLDEARKTLDDVKKHGIWIGGATKADNLDIANRKVQEAEAAIVHETAKGIEREVSNFLAGDPDAIVRMQARAQHPTAFSQVGPGGKTMGSAILDLPPNPAAMARRIEGDKFREAMADEEEAGLKRMAERAKQKAAAAKADVAYDEIVADLDAHHDKLREKAKEAEAKAKAKAKEAEAKANTERFKNTVGFEEEEEKRKAREAEKAATEAERRARQAGIDKFADPLQRDFPGLSDEQAEHWGRRAAELQKTGLNDRAAYNQVFNQVIGIMLQQNAQQEQMRGVMGEWTMRFQNFRQQMQNQQRSRLPRVR